MSSTTKIVTLPVRMVSPLFHPNLTLIVQMRYHFEMIVHRAKFIEKCGETMQGAKWWQTGVVYQIYPRSFMDTNGDGVGDIAGIIEKLDYLVQLGVDCIWLSPFYPSPMKDFGYDVADYCDVDPLFGDLETMGKLIQEAHQKGLRIIIDWVPNHTSDQHAWFIESRSSKDNPKRDWYIWKPAKPDGSLPNNWGSMFGGAAWRLDPQTNEYHFHQFVPEQPDLNWRNPEVEHAMLDVLRFWLSRGVDGFRMDVINLIIKHPDMPDQPLVPNAKVRGEGDIYSTQEHPYDQDYDGIHDMMLKIRGVLDEFGDTVAVGEIWLPLDPWKLYYGTPEAPELHLPFNFRLMDTAWTAEAVRKEIELLETTVPPHGFPNYVLNNHDRARFASRVSTKQARIAGMLLLTLRGTPTLYMGEELGMVNGDIKPEQMQDPQGINLGVAHTRDVCRTPFQWDDSPYAGFSKVDTWLPVNSDYKTRNAKAQFSDPHSMLSLYRAMLSLRKSTPALTMGAYESVPAPEGVFAYLRIHENTRYLMVLNFTSKPVSFECDAKGEIVCDTGLKRLGENFPKVLELWGDEGVIILLK